MNFSEALLTLVVALCVFGPNKLPMVARHLGKLLRHWHTYKQQAMTLWHQYVQEQQLEENRKKAEAADAAYQKKLS